MVRKIKRRRPGSNAH